MTAMITSWGGRKCTSRKTTSACPTTRSRNAMNRIQRRAVSGYPPSFILVHPFVMPVPLALEKFLRVVLQLELQEFLHLREAGVDLAAQPVAVVGREVAAAVLEPDVDQAPEHVARLDEAARRVLDVHVEDDARIGPARPRHEALAVLLDQAHGAVDDVDLVAARVVAHVRHEALERVALAVDLGDRLGGADLRADALVERAVVVLRIDAHLRLVRPVDLAVRGDVVAGVAAGRLPPPRGGGGGGLD